MGLMQPLRDEHATLVPAIEAFRTTADVVGDAAVDDVQELVDNSLGFLVQDLLPHATAEDQVLYPAVERVMGAADATATMRRDHVAIVRLTRELGELGGRLGTSATLPDTLARELRRVLYGLYALVKVHFAKEEEIYLPLLEARLTDAETTELFTRMKTATPHARAQ